MKKDFINFLIAVGLLVLITWVWVFLDSVVFGGFDVDIVDSIISVILAYFLMNNFKLYKK